MIPAAFGLAATQINILIDNQLASYLGNGPVSWLNYAFRLMQLPIGLFGVAIATVHLATASKNVAAKDLDSLKTNVLEAIRLAAFLNIPATFGLIFLRYPIVNVLYERGRFTAQHTIFTGDALLFYGLGLYAYSLVKIITPTFYALGDTRSPVRIAAMVIAVKLAVNLALIRHMGFRGLALGTSVASILNTLLLIWTLQKRIGGLKVREVIPSLLKITAAGLIMGVAAAQIHSWLTMLIGRAHLLNRVAALGISIVSALALLLFVSYLLKIEQATDLMRILRRRFSR
jgi:putative peptidoglycan lipid II flippase